MFIDEEADEAVEMQNVFESSSFCEEKKRKKRRKYIRVWSLPRNNDDNRNDQNDNNNDKTTTMTTKATKKATTTTRTTTAFEHTFHDDVKPDVGCRRKLMPMTAATLKEVIKCVVEDSTTVTRNVTRKRRFSKCGKGRRPRSFRTSRRRLMRRL